VVLEREEYRTWRSEETVNESDMYRACGVFQIGRTPGRSELDAISGVAMSILQRCNSIYRYMACSPPHASPAGRPGDA
jgi:hypothetical protein